MSTRHTSIHTVVAVDSKLARRRKRGMALPLVLALLVLLAIMGTSFLSTSRIDRSASAANQASTQVDMLIDGLWAMARSNVSYDVYDAAQDPPRYRPSSDAQEPSSYRPVDSHYDTFLADRVPTSIDGRMTWANITGPLNGSNFQDPTKPGNGPKFGRVKLVPDSIALNGQLLPAFDYAGQKYLAADADGDGIADAGLWPLGVGQTNGVAWFAAARIVDHNSAINASVAFAPSRDGSLPGQFFPTNVNLQSFLAGGRAELDRLNDFRFNGRSQNVSPIDDDGMPNAQFAFLSPQDALWMQLGRRLNNPGFVAPGIRFRPFPASDSAALARPIRGQSGSTLVSILADSLPPGRTRPFPANDIANWAKQFDFDHPSFNRQSLLTTSNPVANGAVARAVPAQLEKYFGKAAEIPTRTSINTADFPELFRAFWAVMCDKPLATEFGDAVAQRNLYDKDGKVLRSIDDYNPFRPTHPQRMFRSPIRDVRFEYVENETYDSGPGEQEKRTARLKPMDVMLFRAAIAAVNAIDLRDADHDVTVRTIPLKATLDNVEVDVNVKVYGNEPQPFLTEVYAHTDTHTPGGAANKPNPAGYVAIELHNPHPFDIRLTNWRLALVNRKRDSAAPAERTLTYLADVSAVVPALGYLILENYDPAGGSTQAAAYRPRSSGLPAEGALANGAGSVYVPNLAHVIANSTSDGGELVILRPPNENGTGASTDDDLVPVDQFDFTGLAYSPAPPPAPPGEETLFPYTIWHYARGTGPANAWKFVYPGRYDGARPDRRHDGTEVTEVADPHDEPVKSIAHLGGDGNASYNNPFPGIQIAAVDTPGPFPLKSSGNRFPFGGFARLGDILHVPFVGAYRIASADGIVELHSVAMDTAFGDDADPGDDGEEQIGRFNPILGSGATNQTADLRDHPPIDWSAHAAAEHGVAKVYENLRIRPPLNTKGLRVGCVEEWGWVPRSVTIRNMDIGHVYRTIPGLHIDCLQIQLAGDAPTITTDVTIENVYLHDTDVESLLIQDGKFGTVKIKNVRRGPNVKGYKLYCLNSGSFERIIIEDCPNTKFSVAGRPGVPGGNVGPITVINSPGIEVRDEEHVGLNVTYINNGGDVPQVSANDFGPDSAAWRYHWALDLFDHFTTVANPADDYFPNVDPKNASFAKPVRNGLGQLANNHHEDDAPIEGLININTAPWPVLAALPMCDDPADNVALAKAIVAHRESTGRPFASLFELNNVFDPADGTRGFRNGWGKLDFKQDFTIADGDLSPLSGGGDGVADDFEQKNLMLTQISNLITTRSDTFTVYLMVQGWRNAGTPQAEIVAQRRAAYTLDRSALTGMSRTLKTMSVPMD